MVPDNLWTSSVEVGQHFASFNGELSRFDKMANTWPAYYVNFCDTGLTHTYSKQFSDFFFLPVQSRFTQSLGSAN